MKRFVVRITDAVGVDRQLVVSVVDAESLGSVVHMALDQVMAEAGPQIQYPVFLDIHAAGQFSNVAWMHRN